MNYRTSRQIANNFERKRKESQHDLNSMNVEQWKKDVIYKCSPYTVTHVHAQLDLINAVEEIVKKDLPGDFVECGVFMGGSCMLIAEVLNHYNINRTIWLFDTFSGVPLPNDNELTYEGDSLKEWYAANHIDDNNESSWCYTALADIKTNFAQCDYKGNTEFVIGKVEDTIPNTLPESICLLRVDVDLEYSTRHILEHMYPRIVKSGQLILDDYGHFPKVKETVDEYLIGIGCDPSNLIEVDYTVRRLIK